jgi:hypothetical protein
MIMMQPHTDIDIDISISLKVLAKQVSVTGGDYND